MYKNTKEIPSWTKWLVLAAILVFIAVIVFLIILYLGIQTSKTDGYPEAEARVMNQTDIVEIEDTMPFHGDTGYHVVFGKTNSNTNLIVFVPDNSKDELSIVDQAEIISADKIEAKWKSDCSNCELFKIVPALIKETPLWEITYTDEANRYVIDYVSIFDGSQYEQFRFKKMFE